MDLAYNEFGDSIVKSEQEPYVPAAANPLGESHSGVATSHHLACGNLPLRCYIYGDSSEKFFGECIDLDILVRAETATLAEQKLLEAIEGFLRTALEMSEADALIPRRSPLSRRVVYLVRSWLAPVRQHAETKFFASSPAMIL